MHLYEDKKKKFYFYILIFFLLSTVSNNKFLNISKIYLINHIEINNLEENLKKIVEKNITTIKGKNIFFIKKDEVNNKFKTIKFIENKSIKKKFPSTLIINVNRTELLAKINIGNKKYYLGSNGYLIDYNLISSKKDLPYFFGRYEKKEFIKFLNYLKEADFELKKIRSFYYFPSGRWDLVTKEGIKIKLPKYDLNYSLDLSKKIIKKQNKKNYLIDLRVKEKIIINDGKK